MSDWITSDWHFNHKNICGPALSQWSRGYRNFVSLSDMNDTIINNINSVVGYSDTLYFLGDFAFGNKARIPSLRERIICRDIRLIYGNHDKSIRKNKDFQHLFTWCKDYFEYRHKTGLLVIMSHYPLAVWNENGIDSINLHGHSHGNYPAKGKQLDVGIDCHDFKPLLIDTIVNNMNNVVKYLPDHHTEKTNYD